MLIVNLSLTTVIPCLSNHFFSSIKRWLIDDHIYDKSARAIPYDSQQLYDFVGVANTNPPYGGGISTPTSLTLYHEYYVEGKLVVDQFSKSGLSLGQNYYWKVGMKLGVNRFYLKATGGGVSGTWVSSTIQYNCYYVHVFLSLYAMELLNLRKVQAQARQNLFMTSGATGDMVDPWLNTGIGSFDPEWDILRDVGGYLTLNKYSGLDLSGFGEKIKKIYEATLYAGTRKAIDLVAEALEVELQIAPYHSIVFFNSGLTQWTWKFVAGTDFPNVVAGEDYCWASNFVRFDDRFILLKKSTWTVRKYGTHFEGEISNVDYSGDLWAYVDGRICRDLSYSVADCLQFHVSKNTPPALNQVVEITEDFVDGETIHTDDDEGTVTGLPYCKYIVLFNRPVDIKNIKDLEDVGATHIDTSVAELIPGTRVIRLNWYQPIINTIQVIYRTKTFSKILGKVSYESPDPMTRLITDICYQARTNDGETGEVNRRAIYMTGTERRAVMEMYLSDEYASGEYAYCRIASVYDSPPRATINPGTWPAGWTEDNILLGGEMELEKDVPPYFDHGTKFRIIKQEGMTLYLDVYPEGCAGKWVMLRDYNVVIAREMIQSIISFLKPTHKKIYYLVPRLPSDADSSRPQLENYKLYAVI